MKLIKKMLKWSAITLIVLVVIGLIANAAFVWVTDSRLESELGAIRDAGDPVSLADLTRKQIPPEENAVTYLSQAEADIAAFATVMMDLTDVSTCPGYRMPPEDQEKIKAAFAAYPNVVPLLEQAAACPSYDAHLDYTASPTEFLKHLIDNHVMQQPRDAARVLRARAALLLAEGNRDEAVRTALVIFRLARHFDHNPTSIGYLVALAARGYAIASANEALQTGPVSKEVRDALDAELAIQERMEGYTRAVKSERAFTLDSLNKVVLGRNFWLFNRGYWNLQEFECLKVFQAFVAISVDPGPLCQTDRAIRSTCDPIISGMASQAQSLIPPLCATNIAVTGTRAKIRELRILNALQTQVPPDSDETPKLTDLGLPAETLIDPYDGKPLRVKKTPQGWIVYSVGQNYEDDDGRLDTPPSGDLGIGPPPPVSKPAEVGQANGKSGG